MPKGNRKKCKLCHTFARKGTGYCSKHLPASMKTSKKWLGKDFYYGRDYESRGTKWDTDEYGVRSGHYGALREGYK